MSKFVIFPCMQKKAPDGSLTATVVSLISAMDSSMVLFFPIPAETGKIINYVLQVENQKDVDVSTLDIYKTMIDSWSAGGRFLSGVIMDSRFDSSMKEDVVGITLVISSRNGHLDSLVKVNFVHGIILAAMERIDVLFTENLLKQLVPEAFDEEDEDDAIPDFFSDDASKKPEYPSDPNISMIARQIMDGSIKPDEAPKEDSSPTKEDSSEDKKSQTKTRKKKTPPKK